MAEKIRISPDLPGLTAEQKRAAEQLTNRVERRFLRHKDDELMLWLKNITYQRLLRKIIVDHG